MCLMNIAVTQETSEKARELSEKGIASSLNPAKNPPVESTANTENRNAISHCPSPAFYWTTVKIQMHRSLPSFSMFFFFPREFQSTCSIYPRWKKPVLCYKCITPQDSLKQLWFEGKNLAAGERNDVPWLVTSPRGSWIFRKEGDFILKNQDTDQKKQLQFPLQGPHTAWISPGSIHFCCLNHYFKLLLAMVGSHVTVMCCKLSHPQPYPHPHPHANTNYRKTNNNQAWNTAPLHLQKCNHTALPEKGEATEISRPRVALLKRDHSEYFGLGMLKGRVGLGGKEGNLYLYLYLLPLFLLNTRMLLAACWLG